jgi:hypothetical protein
VFPNACRDSFHYFRGNCFYAEDPTQKYWWDNVKYNSVAEWESAGAQTGNIDSLPGFVDPDSEDLHLAQGSACIDHGTPDSAAADDYDDNPRPLGAGFDIGAFEYVPVALAGPGVPGVHRTRGSATVIRSVLLTGDGSSTSSGPNWLLDATGRRVLKLLAGANDLGQLSAGVYFVRRPDVAVTDRIVVVR